MALLNLDKEKFDSSMGLLLTYANTNVIENMTEIAKKLSNAPDANGLVDKIMTNFKSFENMYNEFLDGVEGIKGQMSSVYNIAEFLEKGGKVEEASKRETTFKVDTIDDDGLRF